MTIPRNEKANGVPPVERKRVRVLLVLYDAIVYVTCTILAVFGHREVAQSVVFGDYLLNAAFCAVCVFGMRFAFKVYKQIWRTGSVRAFVRLIAADTVGGAGYLAVGWFVRMRFGPTITFSAVVTLLLLDLIAALVARMAYYYLYCYATTDSKPARFLKAFLRAVALVDFDSSKPGALLKVVLEPVERSSDPINEMQRVTRQFAIRGEVKAIKQLSKGYINQTYRVETLSETGHIHTYTLQRINTNVFPDVDALMHNFVLVTDFLHGRFLLPGHTEAGCVQMMRPTKDGRSYLRDSSGCWRMMTHFDGVYSLDIPDSPQTFYHAGQAFGRFIRELSDMDANRVRTVIPNFHNTWSRYCDLEKIIQDDPLGRVKDVETEIEFVRAHKYIYRMIADKLESGQIPTRICHNDCNLNNILFDNTTKLPVAIIDLDTVMPSSPLYDYGDSMRIGTNTAVDDEKDLSKVSCDLNLYEQYARGWLESCGKMLTGEELRLLPYASLVITSEDGIRFLMDYIQGDTYYHIFYPGQNLDRARTQLHLLADMEQKLPQIKEILRRIYKELDLDYAPIAEGTVA